MDAGREAYDARSCSSFVDRVPLKECMSPPLRNDRYTTHPHPAITIAVTNSVIDPDWAEALYIDTIETVPVDPQIMDTALVQGFGSHLATRENLFRNICSLPR